MVYVLDLEALDQTQVSVAGGKGAALGELLRIDGICVPAGFCVTAGAFRRILAEAPSIQDFLADLSLVGAQDDDAIRKLSSQLRELIASLPIPEDLASEIRRAVARFGEGARFVVRSSATTEDLAGASFAGQHDSYLNVVGADAVLKHVSRCWASAFTERAVSYRGRQGFEHRKTHMAVAVQQMVDAKAAGVLFTADPVTSNRKIASVEAGLGLGEALVSGLVNTDSFKVRDGGIVARTLAPEHRGQPALTDGQVVRLVTLGRAVEAHFGRPQDIEWCLADDGFWIVQSRPITTLFPIPRPGDTDKHVYVSVGHGQMMTDAMKPLGLSIWQLTALVEMHEAGSRLFVDVMARLASPRTRVALLDAMERSDPLIGGALRMILERGDFVPSSPEQAQPESRANAAALRAADPPALIEADHALVAELTETDQAAVAALKREIQSRSGTALLDFILDDIKELKRLLSDPRLYQVIRAGMEASWWLNERLEAWLGEHNAADVLARSVPNNITSEMGLALLEVADVIRPHPEVVSFLRTVDEDFIEELEVLEGGREARDAIQHYLDRYGMRCVGEIDITRPRWSERPATLVPLILDNVENFEPGEAKRRFEQGRREARQQEDSVLERLRLLEDGERKAQEAKRMIDRLRTFAGYREYPKYGIVSRHFVYKQALLAEADRLVQLGVLRDREEIFYLWFEELREVVGTRRLDGRLIGRRKEAFRSHQSLTPPRVLTSDGEVVAGSHRRDDAPAGALVGLPVSTGTIEGRARVVLDLAAADFEPGDILVTAFTDPSWTPAFVAVRGLVTEVGGLMTHGAVIAREYGLPAVVGVEDATRLIPDKQRIRVDGSQGYVEILR